MFIAMKINACEIKCLRRSINMTRRCRLKNNENREMVGATRFVAYTETEKKVRGSFNEKSTKLPLLCA